MVGRDSDFAVYSESHASFNSADIEAGIEQSDATGVAKYHGFQERLANRVYESATSPKTEAVTDGGDDE